MRFSLRIDRYPAEPLCLKSLNERLKQQNNPLLYGAVCLELEMEVAGIRLDPEEHTYLDSLQEELSYTFDSDLEEYGIELDDIGHRHGSIRVQTQKVFFGNGTKYFLVFILE